ncbi:MAG: ATP-binding protein [Corallococcus sp.]|nr:ATP-binding protein [Corallococcus sp.]MCM1359069.1 ATP-binding protein [Corallococcus sp.]MCM1395058.1 ATP-binding protein [Corallococcus sp.]
MEKEKLREQKLIQLIDNQIESEFVDFKQEFYHKETTQDLIKDVMSFANSESNEEKYIIVGVANNYELCDIDYDKVRDISEINQVLKEYCEPFINVEIFKFTYKGKKLLSLVISDNVDRPYLIKKDYHKNGKKLLGSGEIYIRHGATNFKANRNDLDCIYANREKILLTVKDNAIRFINLRHGHKKEQVCCVQILIDNNSNRSIIVHKGKIYWQYYNTSTSSQISYIENQDDVYTKELTSIDVKPLQIQAHSQYQKILFVKVSNEMVEIVRNKEKEKEKLKFSISLIDASNKEMKFEMLINTIIFELN